MITVKCAAIEEPVAAYGFTVRNNHVRVHAGAGLAAGGKGEALRQALAWLSEGAHRPSPVTLRVRHDVAPEAAAEHLQLLADQGWQVQIEPVSAEWVSEAEALARRVALGLQLTPTKRRRPRRAPHRVPFLAPQPRPLRRTTQTEAARPCREGLVLICDGGFKPLCRAAGLAAYGFVARREEQLLHRERGVICHGPAAGSQMAELGAIVAGLRWLAKSSEHRGSHVELRCDCQGVVYSLAGRSRMRLRRGSVMLARTAERLLVSLERRGCRVSLTHIPRKLAKEADKLCRSVYTQIPPNRHPVQAFLGILKVDAL